MQQNSAMNKYSNIKYWEKFYKKFNIKKETKFSRFVLKRINRNNKLIDIGCGNGRDTFFFLKKKIISVGADKCFFVIKNNLSINKNFIHIILFSIS